MPARLSRLHYVLHELRRRHVIRVVGAYVFCVWVVLQVCAIVFPPLMVPAWVLTVLVVLAIIGLPLTSVLTWMYDITPRGVVRTRPLPHHEVEPLHVNWHFVDLVVIAALLSVLAFVILKPEPSAFSQPGRSIAVLPFSDLSVDQDNAYFSDGLSEVLIDSLGRIGGLRVMSRTSSFVFRGQDVDLASLAERLGVDSILEGSVRKSGDRVRVSARLVDARMGHNLWTDTYDARLDDIFQVQDSIARAIADVLQIQLLGDKALVDVATSVDDAYDLYLRGRAYLRREGVLENVVAAIDHFERALQLDRRFALARAGLCTAHWQRYEITRRAELAAEALQTCEDAEIHDDQRAETYLALGNILTGTGQYERALTSFNRAHEIDPDRSDLQLGLAYLMELTGQEAEAELHYRRAIELDPAYWRNYSYLSAFLAASGRLQEAITEIHKGIRLEPSSPRLYSNLGGFYLIAGDPARAAEAFTESIARGPTGPAFSNAGTAYFYSGDYARAEDMFRQAITISPADYRLHGHLAEAISIQGGHDDDAEHHYKVAIRLGKERLEVNPNDHDCRSMLALNLIKAGQQEAAQEEYLFLSEQARLSRQAHWHMGEIAFLLDDIDSALYHFRHAVELGMNPEQFAHNPALQSLYDNPRFLALIRTESNQF